MSRAACICGHLDGEHSLHAFGRCTIDECPCQAFSACWPDPGPSIARAIAQARPVFEAMRRDELRQDYANGCRCDACITVHVEDEVLPRAH